MSLSSRAPSPRTVASRPTPARSPWPTPARSSAAHPAKTSPASNNRKPTVQSRDIVCATAVAAGVILVALLPVSSFGQDQGLVPAPGAQGKGGGKGGGRGRGGKQRPPSGPT